ncbi:MAG TPA: superinfection immunity protein [Terriglobales bacterium]|nr:superinfection immunity protein [Terriglobales bacterium]
MTTESVVAVFFGLFALALWMVPAVIAFSRKHPKRMAILIIDLLASWTIVGWFFALSWALRTWEESPEEPKAKASAA